MTLPCGRVGPQGRGGPPGVDLDARSPLCSRPARPPYWPPPTASHFRRARRSKVAATIRNKKRTVRGQGECARPAHAGIAPGTAGLQAAPGRLLPAGSPGARRGAEDRAGRPSARRGQRAAVRRHDRRRDGGAHRGSARRRPPRRPRRTGRPAPDRRRAARQSRLRRPLRRDPAGGPRRSLGVPRRGRDGTGRTQFAPPQAARTRGRQGGFQARAPAGPPAASALDGRAGAEVPASSPCCSFWRP